MNIKNENTNIVGFRTYRTNPSTIQALTFSVLSCIVILQSTSNCETKICINQSQKYKLIFNIASKVTTVAKIAPNKILYNAIET